MNTNQEFSIPKNLAISQSGFLFVPTSGETFTLNEIGIWIFNQLQQEKSRDEILNLIIEKYDIDKKNAEFDFEDFIFQLERFSLLTIK